MGNVFVRNESIDPVSRSFGTLPFLFFDFAYILRLL